MTVQLATGNTGKAVTSASDRRLYAGMVDTGMHVQKVGKQCKASLSGPNKLVVENGSLMINGAHVDMLGNTEYTIPSGLQGKKRATICGVLYSASADGTEDAEKMAYTGDAVDSGTPPDPEYPDGSILDGDTSVFMPLYRVVTDGINALEPVPLFDVMVPAKEAWDSQNHRLGDFAASTTNGTNRLDLIAQTSDGGYMSVCFGTDVIWFRRFDAAGETILSKKTPWQ